MRAELFISGITLDVELLDEVFDFIEPYLPIDGVCYRTQDGLLIRIPDLFIPVGLSKSTLEYGDIAFVYPSRAIFICLRRSLLLSSAVKIGKILYACEG